MGRDGAGSAFRGQDPTQREDPGPAAPGPCSPRELSPPDHHPSGGTSSSLHKIWAQGADTGPPGELAGAGDPEGLPERLPSPHQPPWAPCRPPWWGALPPRTVHWYEGRERREDSRQGARTPRQPPRHSGLTSHPWVTPRALRPSPTATTSPGPPSGDATPSTPLPARVGCSCFGVPASQPVPLQPASCTSDRDTREQVRPPPELQKTKQDMEHVCPRLDGSAGCGRARKRTEGSWQRCEPRP